MEDVITLSSENRTVVAGDMTVWTTSVEWNATYPAYIVVRDIPFPYRYRVDSFNLDLHPPSTKSTTEGSRNGLVNARSAYNSVIPGIVICHHFHHLFSRPTQQRVSTRRGNDVGLPILSVTA